MLNFNGRLTINVNEQEEKSMLTLGKEASEGVGKTKQNILKEWRGRL